MSYTSITSGEIQSGQPVATTTQTKIKTNLDDHETRILSLEASSAVYPPIIFRVNGFYMPVNGVLKTTANFSLNITGVWLIIDQAGSNNSTQIDIKRKRGAGAYESILSTLPSVPYIAGNDARSTNGVLDPTKVDIQVGDILRLDISAVQTDGQSFMVRIDYNRGA